MCQAGRRVSRVREEGETPEEEESERAGPTPAGPAERGSSRGTGIAFSSRFCCRGISPHHAPSSFPTHTSSLLLPPPRALFFFSLSSFSSLLSFSPHDFSFPWITRKITRQKEEKEEEEEIDRGLVYS